MSNLRRLPIAARGAGDADRGQEYRRSLGDESLRRGAVLPRSGAYRLATAGRPDDARTGPRAARIPRGRRLALPDARPHPADLERRRTAKSRPHLRPRIEPGQHALRARRTFDRAPPARHPPTARRDHRPPRPRKHRGRGGARRGDHPRRRPGDRDRTRRRRAGREDRLPGHPERNGKLARQPHRRLPGRAPRRGGRRPAATAGPRLDPPGRSAGQQPAEYHRRVSPWGALPGDRGERVGQEHARPGDPLSGPLPPFAKRCRQTLSLRRHLRRRPDR